MTTRKGILASSFIALVLLMSFTANADLPTTKPATQPATAPALKSSGVISVKAPATGAVGVPVVLTLTVQNTGQTPFPYTGSFPPAEDFVAVLEGADKKLMECPLSNAGCVTANQLFGTSGEIAPGTTIEMPAVIDPLPAGRYTIKRVYRPEKLAYSQEGPIIWWPAMSVNLNQELVVREDAAAVAAFGREVLKGFRANEPLAQFLAYRYNVPAVLEALNQDLQGPDREATENAINFMIGWPTHPPTVGRAIARLVHEDLSKERFDSQVLGQLIAYASQDQSDASLDAVLDVLAHPSIAKHPERWIGYLDAFKQPRATQALRRYLTDERRPVRFAAGIGLAAQRDPSAVPVLLAMLKELEEKHNGKEVQDAMAMEPADTILRVLSDCMYRDPRVVEAIRQAAASPDETVRKAAEHPMERQKYFEAHPDQ